MRRELAMLRYRAMEREKGKNSKVEDQLCQTDRNGKIASAVAPLANWATREGNKITRPLLEKTMGIHQQAAVPKFVGFLPSPSGRLAYGLRLRRGVGGWGHSASFARSRSRRYCGYSS